MNLISEGILINSHNNKVVVRTNHIESIKSDYTETSIVIDLIYRYVIYYLMNIIIQPIL